jgi:hypothetical protein
MHTVNTLPAAPLPARARHAGQAMAAEGHAQAGRAHRDSTAAGEHACAAAEVAPGMLPEAASVAEVLPSILLGTTAARPALIHGIATRHAEEAGILDATITHLQKILAIHIVSIQGAQLQPAATKIAALGLTDAAIP